MHSSVIEELILRLWLPNEWQNIAVNKSKVTVYLEFESLCNWKQLRDSHHWLHCHLTSLISLSHYILTHSKTHSGSYVTALQLASIPRTLLLSNPRPTSVWCAVKLQRSAALFYLTTGIDPIPDPRSLCERSETRWKQKHHLHRMFATGLI